MSNGQDEASLRQNLYYYIGERTNSDWTTDPGTAVLLTIFTCGIYGVYLFYKLFDRRDRHFARVANMAGSAIALLKERARAMGKTDLISNELQQLDFIHRELYDMSRERGAALWLVISLFTGGIGTFIGYYLLMDDFARHDEAEARFFTAMSTALAKLGLASGSSEAGLSIPKRDFVTFLLLSLVTCGIYSFYWIYVLVLDGNTNFESQVSWEDFIYKALSS